LDHPDLRQEIVRTCRFSRTELLEQMAEIYYRARTAGEPVILTTEEMAEVTAKIHDYGQSKPSIPQDGQR
jgi:hypothetical protein